MKATVYDFTLLGHLEPQQIETYLTGAGWQEHHRIPDRFSAWTNDNYQMLKIYLPLDREFEDYPQRIAEVVETMEKTEGRSQLEIIRKLITDIPNINIQGLIVQVQPPEGDRLSGEITMFGVVIDQLRQIKTSLFDRDYIMAMAIKAYTERLPIRCTGDLVK